MEQIGSVYEYFSDFVHCVQSLDLNDYESLQCFLNGLQTFFHREIIFDDSQTLWDAFCLAKFYERRWMNPCSEISKPDLSSHIQIQIQISSSKFFSRKFISNIYRRSSNSRSTIKSSKLASRNSTFKFTNRSRSSNIHQQHSSKNFKNTTITEQDQKLRVNDAEDSVFAEGNVEDADLELAEEERVNRSPPKPSNFTLNGGKDLRSLAHEIGGTAPSDGDAGLVASSGAEDGAFTKGKRMAETIEHRATPVMEDRAAKVEMTSLATVGMATRSATKKILSPAVVKCRCPQTNSRRRAFLLVPPPLLAAVFPWDRVEESEEPKKCYGRVVKDADPVFIGAIDDERIGFLANSPQSLRSSFWRRLEGDS
ncbi:hypothetical protein PIB30_101403, partial [Stylosanthes scabra]|nr:hypothetical protein [Stylosanthes scabra]